MKFRPVPDRIKAWVFPRLGQQVARGGVALDPLGAEVKRFAQALKARFWFAQHDVKRGDVIPRFGLVRGEGDDFLKGPFEFCQVVHFGIFLRDVTGFVGSNMQVGQCMLKKFNGPVGLLHLKVDVGEGQEVLKIA